MWMSFHIYRAGCKSPDFTFINSMPAVTSTEAVSLVTWLPHYPTHIHIMLQTQNTYCRHFGSSQSPWVSWFPRVYLFTATTPLELEDASSSLTESFLFLWPQPITVTPYFINPRYHATLTDRGWGLLRLRSVISPLPWLRIFFVLRQYHLNPSKHIPFILGRCQHS